MNSSWSKLTASTVRDTLGESDVVLACRVNMLTRNHRYRPLLLRVRLPASGLRSITIRRARSTTRLAPTPCVHHPLRLRFRRGRQLVGSHLSDRRRQDKHPEGRPVRLQEAEHRDDLHGDRQGARSAATSAHAGRSDAPVSRSGCLGYEVSTSSETRLMSDVAHACALGHASRMACW